MKKFVLTILGIVVLFSSVYAATTIQAYLANDVTIKLNGVQLDMKDAQGNKVYPLNYNGTTYLPVRAVAENLGLDVKWVAETKTVELSPAKVNVSSGKSKIREVTNFDRLSFDENKSMGYSEILLKIAGTSDISTFLRSDSIKYTLLNKSKYTLKNIKYYVMYTKTEKIFEISCDELKSFENSTVSMNILNLDDYNLSDVIYKIFDVEYNGHTYRVVSDRDDIHHGYWYMQVN